MKEAYELQIETNQSRKVTYKHDSEALLFISFLSFDEQGFKKIKSLSKQPEVMIKKRIANSQHHLTD